MNYLLQPTPGGTGLSIRGTKEVFPTMTKLINHYKNRKRPSLPVQLIDSSIRGMYPLTACGRGHNTRPLLDAVAIEIAVCFTKHPINPQQLCLGLLCGTLTFRVDCITLSSRYMGQTPGRRGHWRAQREKR